MTNSTFSLIVKIIPSFIDCMKTKYLHFNQLDSYEKLKIILNPDKEILPSVYNFIKRSNSGSCICLYIYIYIGSGCGGVV